MGVYKKFYGCTFFNEEDMKEAGIEGKVELNYYKIQSDNANTLNEDKGLYGIEVVKKQYGINDRIYEEVQSVKDITKNEGCVNKMLETLKEYKVTPVGLENVIDDLKQIWK